MICSFQQLQSNYFLVLNSVSFSVLYLYSSVNFSCAHPPPPLRATAGYLPAVSVPGMGHLQILRYPGTGHLPTLGLFPSFWHARGFLSEYNYTEDITEKKADWLICPGQGVEKTCSRFYACISSLLIKPELHSKTRELSTWINSFWLVNQFLLILFEEHRFIKIKLFITYNFAALY